MNIFKSKKLIATALTFVLVIALAGLPLQAAKEGLGLTVVVTMKLIKVKFCLSRGTF